VRPGIAERLVYLPRFIIIIIANMIMPVNLNSFALLRALLVLHDRGMTSAGLRVRVYSRTVCIMG
jgi:hypothetical protein